MFKILLLALQTTGMELESRKTMLSELLEVIPCIIRLERELSPEMFEHEKIKSIDIQLYEPDDDFYGSFAKRLTSKCDSKREQSLLLTLLTR
jgi:hypothetical protein